MENTEKLSKLLTPVLEECGVKLYDLTWTGGSDHTLQVAIADSQGKMDLDTCATVSEKISEFLDSNDLIQSAYMLEVCSPGAEREIKDLAELESLDQPYVLIQLKQPIKKYMELTGTVLSYHDGVVELEYRDKAVLRKAEIEADQIQKIRFAVKF